MNYICHMFNILEIYINYLESTCSLPETFFQITVFVSFCSYFIHNSGTATAAVGYYSHVITDSTYVVSLSFHFIINIYRVIPKIFPVPQQVLRGTLFEILPFLAIIMVSQTVSESREICSFLYPHE